MNWFLLSVDGTEIWIHVKLRVLGLGLVVCGRGGVEEQSRGGKGRGKEWGQQGDRFAVVVRDLTGKDCICGTRSPRSKRLSGVRTNDRSPAAAFCILKTTILFIHFFACVVGKCKCVCMLTSVWVHICTGGYA